MMLVSHHTPALQALDRALRARDDTQAIEIVDGLEDDVDLIPTHTGMTPLLGHLTKGHLPRFCAHAFGDPDTGAHARITPPEALAAILSGLNRWTFEMAPFLAIAWMRGIPVRGKALSLDPQNPVRTHNIGRVDAPTAHQKIHLLSHMGSPYTPCLTLAQWHETFGAPYPST